MLLLRCILFSTTLPLLVFSLPATPSNSSTPSTPASEIASPSGGSPFSTSAPSSWQHPGFVISKPQLDFIKSQLSGKAQPWTDAYNNMLGDKDKYGAYVSATRSSKARATVECGPVTNPDIGCTDERGDALAAWSNALAGYLTGNEEYTKNAILYMNKWSTVVKSHTNANAVLQTAWSGASWARAGELVRHTTTGLWEDADITSFENMLRNVYLPACKDGTVKAPNWDLACLNTAVGIAVFLEDKEEYEHAMDVFQKAVPTIIYMEADGNLPLAREGESRDKKTLQGAWYNQQTWGNSGQSGQIAETCRDLTHTGYSISSISHILETSRIQGSDQYNSDIGDRLRASLEFHTGLADSSSAPSWLCSGKPSRVLEYVTEIGYNAFVTRGGASMPQTEKYTEKERPQGTNGLFYGWETLTHAGNKA